jgi:hypothetical protein
MEWATWPQKRLLTIAEPVDRAADDSWESVIREDCGRSGTNLRFAVSGLLPHRR